MINKSNYYVACTHLHVCVETTSTYLCFSSPHPPHRLLTLLSLFYSPTPPGALHPEPVYQKTMALGPYLAYDGVDYECTICERFFGSKSSLYAHCKQTSRHAWCERCCRLFISTPAKNAHLLESSRHNMCLLCPQPQDFGTSKELQNHLVESHHFCSDCNLYYNSIEQLQKHDVTQHHLCTKCGVYFANKNSLQMVVDQF